MSEEKRKINVLIADADKVCASEMMRGIESYCSDFSCKLCYSGDTVKSKVEKYNTEILIMNLMLPVLDAIAVLDSIRKENTDLKLIIILSPISRDILIKTCISHGADYYIVTPVEPAELARRLIFLYDIAVSETDSLTEYINESANAPDEMPIVHENVGISSLLIPEYRKRIRRFLTQLGVPGKVKGFAFLEEAVVMVLEDRRSINNITKIIYPIVGRRFGSTNATVERSIRTAIDLAWKKPNGPEHIKEVFGFASVCFNKKPSNADFIAMIADKLTVDGG